MKEVTPQIETPFYVTGGTMPRNALSYVERDADRILLEELRAGQFCYVLTSRQMGKSSLMVRTAARLREEGYAVAVLDLTAVGQNLSPEQWYDGLLNLLARALDLEEELDEFWLKNRHLGPLQRWVQGLKDVVLTQIPGNIVLFLEEIDAARSLPFSIDELFAAIRECHNLRAEEPKYRRLTFCFLGVATPADLIRDTRITPFNVGRRITLTDFRPEEAALFAEGFRAEGVLLPPNDTVFIQQLLARVLYWTGGHPYLTQRLCRAIVESLRQQQADPKGTTQLVDRLCADLFLSPRVRERDDNLIFVRERLLRSDIDTASLLTLYRRILRGALVEDDETNPLVSVLRLSGLVRTSNGRLLVRNPIYATVFDLAWITENLPDGELRRQRTALQYTVLRIAATAGALVLLMASFLGFTLIKARENFKKTAQETEQAQAIAQSVQEANRRLAESLRHAAEGRKLRTVDLFPQGDGWRLESDTESGASSESSKRPDGVTQIKVKAATGQEWDVRAVVPLPKLRPNTYYILSFEARADREHPITVRMQHDRPDWEELGLFRTPELSNRWQAFRWEFVTPSATEAGHGSLVLGLAKHAGTIEIRNAHLMTFDTAPSSGQ